MYFKYAENSIQSSIEKSNEENVVKMGRQLISAAIDVNKALTAQGGGSTFDEVKQYLIELNEVVTQNDKENKNMWEEEVDVLDIEIENEKTGEEND